MFNFSKTQIIVEKEVVTVNTDNISSDFEKDGIFLSNNVYVQNNIIKAKNSANIWFIPFDKNETPLLLRGPSNPNTSIEISCDCHTSRLNACDVKETKLGGGKSQFTCAGACLDPNNPLNISPCTMSVIIGKANINGSSLINGMIVASNAIWFNGKSYGN